MSTSDLAAATIVSKSSISLARVLAESLRSHHPDVRFFVLLADEVDGYFEPENEPFELVRFDELPIPDRARMAARYSQQELTYACTPYLLDHLLGLGFARAAFLKQESLVVGDLTPIFEAMARCTVLLTPHLLEPLGGGDALGRESNILQSGVYNVGFLGVSSTPVAREFLGWWKDRLAEHCLHDVPAGMHFEQRWLDLVPSYFDGVDVVRDPGFNLAHWNLPERQVRIDDGSVSVDGEPCRFVRFSGFDVDRPGRLTRYSSRLTLENVGDAADLFRQYRELLLAAGYETTRRWPYAYYRRASVVRALARRARPLRRLRALAGKVVRGLRE